MVEEREGRYIRIKRLGIAQVANPGVFHYGLDEGLDTSLGGLVSLVVLDAGGPGGLRASAFDVRCALPDGRVVDRWTGGWAREGKAVMVEVPVGVGDEPPEVLDAVGAIVGHLEQDGRERVIDADEIVVGGLSCDGEEGRCGGGEGSARAVGVMVAGWGRNGWFLVARWENLGDNVVDVCKKERKRCSIDTLLSYGLLLVHALVAYPSCAMCGEHFEWCGAGQTLASSLMAQAMYLTYVCPLEA